jgi:hypothetical protein
MCIAEPPSKTALCLYSQNICLCLLREWEEAMTEAST